MLQYICISDLHAGSVTSLLDDRPPPENGKSIMTEAFAQALSGLLKAAGNPEPQLILLGDAVELQFSKRSIATASALSFLKEIKAAGLSNRVLATAGNHDHALWTDARLAIHADSFSTGNPKIDDREATPAFRPAPAARSRLLDALLGAAGFTEVDLRYPNIGLANEDRSILLHHGHFVESEYRLMTKLREALFGVPDREMTVDRLSAENAGWIDFAWSTFGDASGIGRDTEKLYQNFLTTTGFRRLTEAWADDAADAITEMLPTPGRKHLRDTVGMVTRAGFDITLGKFRDTERYAEVDALSSGGLAGLHWYLEGPTRLQIEKELGVVPNDLTFVLGHTHKPFSNHISAVGYPQPIKVFNTGGWTLNGPRLDNAEGAAMVLIDDQLHSVAVRLFNTPRNGKVETAEIQPLSEDDGTKQFATGIKTWMDARPQDWDALARTAETAYAARQAYLLQLTEGVLDGQSFRGAAE